MHWKLLEIKSKLTNEHNGHDTSANGECLNGDCSRNCWKWKSETCNVNIALAENIHEDTSNDTQANGDER